LSSDETFDVSGPSRPMGCVVIVLRVLALAAVVSLVVLLVLARNRKDTEVDQESAVAEPGIEDVDADPGSPTLDVDPDNPDLLIPGGGEWSIDNGMFVPNCGPEEPEVDTVADIGTVDVWASGSVLELAGQNGEAIVFERTAVSATEAVYVGSVGFIEMELVFDSRTRFDASISYDGEGACVRRSAKGSLILGDPDRQHGVETPAATTAPIDAGIDQAEEGTIAVVTIDGESYEYFPEGPVGTCDPDFFGGFNAVLYTEGYVDSLNFDLVTDGSRESTATVTVRELDLDLVADAGGEWAAVEDGTSAVLDFTIEGNTASGAVLFINEDRAFNPTNFPLESIEATFIIRCG